MDNPYSENSGDGGPGPSGNTARLNRMGYCDPKSINNVVSFHYFCEWIKSEEGSRRYTKDEMHERCEKYRRETLNRLFSEFYAAHKDDDWFIERYNPDNQKARQNDIVSRKIPHLEKYLEELRSGKLDDISMDVPENLQQDRDGQDRNGVSSAKDPYDIPENNDDSSNGQQREDEDKTNTLFIRTIPPSVPREAIEVECKKIEGFDYLTLSIPNASRNFHRFGWVKFKPGTDIEKALDGLNNLRVEEFQFHFSKHRANSSVQFRLTPEIANTPSQLRHDLKMMRDAAKTMDESTGNEQFSVTPEIEHRMEIIRAKHTQSINEGDAILVEDAAGSPKYSKDGDSAEGGDENIAIVKKELDLYLEYCRRVHFYCYYCCKVMDSSEDFSRQCAKNHYRRAVRSMAMVKSSSNLNWAKNIHQKNDMIIYPPDITEMYKHGGKSLNEETDKLITGQINHLEEGEVPVRCV